MKTLTPAFNFLEHLAFHIHSENHDETSGGIDLDAFVGSYREQYFIAESLVNRLRHSEYGILDKPGAFRQSYMYYYFLAKFLANNREEHYRLIQGLCRDNHVGDNHLIVLFLIHHTSDDNIIDEILVDCLNILKDLEEASARK